MEDGLFTPIGAHLALVHFPIALLITGTVFELAGRVARRGALSTAGCYALVAGLLVALPVVATGLLSKNEFAGNPILWPLALRHQAFALASVAVFAIAVALRWFTRPKSHRAYAIMYVLLLVAGSAVVSVTGYLGGQIGHSPTHLHEHDSSHARSGAVNTAPDQTLLRFPAPLKQ